MVSVVWIVLCDCGYVGCFLLWLVCLRAYVLTASGVILCLGFWIILGFADLNCGFTLGVGCLLGFCGRCVFSWCWMIGLCCGFALGFDLFGLLFWCLIYCIDSRLEVGWGCMAVWLCGWLIS